MVQQQQRPQYATRSRFGLATPAIRPGMHGRVLLAGPSGSGKTYTALLVASVLAGPERVTESIVMIDTEKDSGKTYADEFVLADGSAGYKHISWAAPYNATDLAMTLRDASTNEACRVVIVDSHSHFWRGEGGVLDVSSGRWTGWKEARPMHADMIDAVLSCDAHVILCARMVQENVQEKNEQTGKIEVRKLGMKVQQDSDLEYEVNVGVEIDMNHIIRVTKSRTRAVPVGTEYIAGHAERFAGEYRDWLAGGEPAATKEQTDALVEVLNRIDDAANRQQAKVEFVNVFGRPEMLLVSRLPEANEWVANKLLGVDETPERAPDAEPGEGTDHVSHPDTHQEGDEPESDPQPTPAEEAAQRAQEAQQRQAARPTDPAGAAAAATTQAELRIKLEEAVLTMDLQAVQDALRASERSTSGSLKNLRKRLVEQRLKEAQAAAA